MKVLLNKLLIDQDFFEQCCDLLSSCWARVVLQNVMALTRELFQRVAHDAALL
jgi:hypothetical protein